MFGRKILLNYGDFWCQISADFKEIKVSTLRQTTCEFCVTMVKWCIHVFLCPFYKKIFTDILNYYFTEYNFSREPMCTLKGSFTNEKGALNDLIMLAALGIFTLFFSFSTRKKNCGEMVCRIGAAPLLKKGMNASIKLSVFIIHNFIFNMNCFL